MWDSWAGKAGTRMGRCRLASMWAALWSSLGAAQPMALPPDSVAVRISLGMRRTGGFSIRIVSAEEAAGVFVVTWAEVAPSRSTSRSSSSVDEGLGPGNGVIYSRRVSALRAGSRLNRIAGTPA